jgi:hypothetical protein
MVDTQLDRAAVSSERTSHVPRCCACCLAASWSCMASLRNQDRPTPSRLKMVSHVASRMVNWRLGLRDPESIDDGSVIPLCRIVGDGAGISVQEKLGY